MELDRALQHWNQVHGEQDQALTIDGKTMRNAIDEQGHQIHITLKKSHMVSPAEHRNKPMQSVF